MSKKKTKKSSPIKKKFALMSMQILENKFLYYEGPKHNLKPYLNDLEYDELETTYKKLAKKLGMKSSSTDMVGWNGERSFCKMIAQHMIASKGRSKAKAIVEEINYYIKDLKRHILIIGITPELKKLYSRLKKEWI